MAGPIRLSSGPIQPSNGPIMPGSGPLNPATAQTQLSSLIASITQQAPVQAAPVPAPTGKAPDQNSPDPISWVFDMLDRPARAIRDSVAATWDNVVDGGKMWSDIAGGKAQNIGKDAGNILGDAGEAVSAPFRGLFSTNANDQQTSSQLIEKGVDKYGKTFDPHYKDTKDNVNPILKGVLGFAGDVATDPLSYLGGPEIRAAITGGKALLTGAKAAKDLAPEIAPAAEAAAKMGDQAIGGDAKAADTLDTVTTGAATDAERAAQTAAEPKAPLSAELTATPDAAKPITADGQAAALTGTAEPIAPGPVAWSLEQENALTAAQKKLDRLNIRVDTPQGTLDAAQKQVDELTAQKAAAHQAVTPAPEAVTPAAESVTPAADAPTAPAAPKSPPVDNPVIPGLKEPEPQSLGDALRASGAGKNFIKAYDGAQKLAQQHNLTMLDTLTRLQQQNKLSTLFGENFLQAMGKYSNPERFGRMLDETYRIIKAGGHLDDGDLETKLPGARSMLNAVVKDAGLAKDKIQTARAAFRARSAVPETADLGSTLARMKGGESLTTGLVKHLEEGDLKTLVKDSLDRLRNDKPGMKNVTRSGAKSTGGDTTKSFAEFRDRIGTHNQVADLVHASLLAATRMKQLDTIGGAARSAMLRNMVMGNTGKAGLVDSLTKIRDELGASHWLEDGAGRAIPLSLHQGLQILGGDLPGQRLVDKLLFNAGTPASKTNIAEAMVAAAHGASRDEILAVLKNTGKRYREGTQTNFLADGAKEGIVDHRLVTASTKLEPGEVAVKNGTKGIFVKESGDSLANKTADLIVSRRADLIAQVRTNEAAYAERFATETRDLTTLAQAQIDEMRADPTLLGNAVSALANPKKLIDAAGDLSGAREDSRAAATVATEATIPEPDQVVAQQIVKSAAAVNRGDLPAARAATQVLSDTAAKPVTEAYDALRAEGIQSGAVADIAHIEDKLPPAAEPPVAGETPIGQPADPLEEVFSAAKYERKAVTAAERIVAGEDAIHGRIQARALGQITSATGVVNKAANMVREGLSYEALDTAMRSQLSELSNKHGGLLLQLSKIDKQVTDKLRISDIVRDDALAGRASIPEYAAQRKLTDQIVAHWMNAGDHTDPNAMLAEPWLRSGASPKAIIKHLESSGVIPKGFKFDEGELETLMEGDRGHYGSFAGSLANLLVQKGVRIPDSYDFYQKMFGATATLGTHAGIAHDFIETGVKQGFVSATKKEGMRRIVIDNDTIFGHFITESHVYADPETFGAMLRMSDLLNPKSKAAGELAHIGQIFDDVQQLWKWGEVAIRPGTRIHNYFSDHIMTMLAMGAKGFRSGFAKSLKMMASSGKDSAGALSQDELIQAIQRVGGNVSDQTFKGANEVLHSGQYGSYTSAQSWRLFHKAGLRTSAKAIERTDKENLSEAGRFGQKFYNSPVGRGASWLTETTENQVRATHFSIALDRALDKGYVVTRWGKKVSVLGKDNKVDEDLLATTLGDAVRRYHPDPHMLTQFERNTIRRVLPFYSWNRGAVPAILDAMYMHPGRGLALNKLSFAVGQSLGVQGNNLADPFPNGMWPGFLTGQAQGPQFNIGGQLFMANPGIPTWDVANMFTDPNNISGSVSPLLAVPATLLSGKDFRTGQPITNKFDALDQQLPIVANYEAASGNSVLGSLVGGLTGNGIQKTSAGAQQQIEPSAGALGWLNWGLGAQISHVNKDSYVQAGIAQQQKRLSDILSGKSPSLGVGG